VFLVFFEHLSISQSGLITGSVYIVSSAVVFAIFILGSGIMVHSIGSNRFTAYSMTVASFATVSHYLVQHGFVIKPFSEKVYSLTVIMAVFSTVLPAFLLNAGILRVGAGNAAIISSVGPILTLILAHLFLNEAVTFMQITGTCLVLTGVYVIGRVKP
jgi:drug/metabolite transporter (DMT)-like permease